MSNQAEFPGMEDNSPLGQVAKRFCSVKEEIAAAKLRSAEIEKEVFAEMDNQGVTHFKVSVGGENYEFDTKASERSLICRKITKTPKKNSVEGDVGAGQEKEPAVA